MFKYVLSMLAALTFTVSAHAATITVEKYSDTGESYVLIDGPIEAGDVYRLNQALADETLPAKGMFIHLNSPGGQKNVMMALRNVVEAKLANTVVSKGSVCYSACAVIWAHGAAKLMEEGAEIGFHVASLAITPKTVEWLESYKAGFGWYHIQMMFQENVSKDMKFYYQMPVAKPAEFVAHIAMYGYNAQAFWLLDESNLHIIGNVRVY